MSEINFLPDSFQKQHARRRRRPVELMVIAGTLAGLIGLWFSLGGPDPSLANELERVEGEIARVHQLYDEQDALAQQRAELQRRLLIARETYQPITTTQALARLSALMPEAVRVVGLEIVNDRPEPELPPKPDKQNKRVVSSAGTGSTEPAPPREPSLMKIALTGQAPNDDQIVTLIRRLGDDPVFSSVALRGSKVDRTRTHYVRQFKLDLTIDMDRRFVPGDTAPNPQGGPDARDED